MLEWLYDWFYWTLILQIVKEMWNNLLCNLTIKKFATSDPKIRLDGKTVIVTGANRGIGKEIARDLSSRGARVIMACRDVTAAEAAVIDIKKKDPTADLSVRQVDMSSFDSVRSFAHTMIREEGHIHVLCNNAGVSDDPFCVTKDGIPLTLQVNYFAPVLLTLLLIPRLQESKGMVVAVGSILHAFPCSLDLFSDVTSGSQQQSFHAKSMSRTWRATTQYGESKALITMFSMQLKGCLEGHGVVVRVVDPGGSITDILRKAKKFKMIYSLFPLCMRPVNLAAESVILSILNDSRTDKTYFMNGKPQQVSKLVANSNKRRYVWRETLRFLGYQHSVYFKYFHAIQ